MISTNSQASAASAGPVYVHGNLIAADSRTPPRILVDIFRATSVRFEVFDCFAARVGWGWPPSVPSTPAMSDNVPRRILCKVALRPCRGRADMVRVPTRNRIDYLDPRRGVTFRAGRHSAVVMVDRVLAYLEGRRRVAEYYCHRSDAATYLTAWITVFEAYYGPNPRPTIRQTQAPTLPRSNPHIDKPWYREKYGRPMRRVVGYVEVSPTAAGDWCGGRWYDCLLECGHTVAGLLDFPDVPRAKHKRCAECPRTDSRAEGPSLAGSVGTKAERQNRNVIMASATGVAELPGGGPALDKRTVPPGCKKPVRSENPRSPGVTANTAAVSHPEAVNCAVPGVLSAHR